jgi:5-methylcytosine-specific restriction endonuclease McrA
MVKPAPPRNCPKPLTAGNPGVCKNGHILTNENLVPWMLKRQKRCRICNAKWNRDYKERKRRENGALPLRGMTHCKNGHAMEGENLTITSAGHRRCQACHREGAMRRARKRGVAAVRRLTPSEKQEQRRKWEATRRARKRAAFVEMVDPATVFARASGVCGICQQPVERFAFEVDHIVPLSRGGAHSYANTQPAHPSCNRKKWAKVA